METINDTVRKVAVEMMNTSMQDITVKVINGWAMRLGATCKKFLPVGNAAKIREALETISKCDISKEEDCYTLYRVCDAALSAPPRNCDRFADELDAQLAFLNEVWLISVDKDTMLERDKFKFENWTEEMKSRYAKWLFAEAKGDAK